jgi:AraC-like DNA-binding protein
MDEGSVIHQRVDGSVATGSGSRGAYPIVDRSFAKSGRIGDLGGQMDEDNQRPINMAASGAGATGGVDHGREPVDYARSARDSPANCESLGSDELSPSNGQLWKGINALIEAMKFALEGDGVSARHYIGSASASLADTGGEVATRVAVPDIRAVRSCGGLAPWQVRRLKIHIEENLGGTIYCEDLARLVSLSLSHFMRAFKESFGCAPHAFLIHRRIERAQGLMLATEEPLGQIALMCGLADQSHLTRLFQKWVGDSPAAWRRARMNARGSP